MSYNTLCDDDLNYEVLFCDNIEEVKFFDNPTNDLNVIHVNVRSIRKNYDDLQLYLESLNKDFDIIVCSETNAVDNPPDFNIEQYEIVYNESKNNKCDGCIVYVKGALLVDYKVVKIDICNFLRVTVCKNNVTLCLTAIYRPPSVEIDIFLNCLKLFLNDKSIHFYNNEIFCGDTNINLFDRNSLNVGNYMNSLNEKGFNCVINQATRKDRNSATCIDHFFVKHGQRCAVHGVILNHSFTDHFPILLNMNISKINESLISKKFADKIDFTKVKQILEEEHWLDVLGCEDVNECTDTFINKLKSIIERSRVRKYITCNKRRIKPWITQGLLNSIRRRDKLKRISAREPENLVALNMYKDHRKMLTKLINKTKVDYYANLFQLNLSDSKKTWDIIKSASNSQKNNQKIGVISNDKGIEILDEKLKADEFNKFFSRIGRELANNITVANVGAIPDNIPRVPGSLFLAPIMDFEVIEIINSLRNTSSAGEDKLKVDFLKRYHRFILKPISHIVNLIFRVGLFPDSLKKCTIMPIHKGGSRSEITNYRPIAIVSNLSKIIEKCIKLRLDDYLKKNKLISDAQYGFRQKLGTEDALMRVVNHISETLDSGNKSLLIFLDLTKAFDTVSHRILLEKIEHIGIRGIPYDLIKSYLIGRTQQVKVGESVSLSLPIECGVPQGTVLGPLLFTIYIDNLLRILSQGSMVCYADDTVIMLRDKTWDRVFERAELAVSKVKLWLDLNLLTLNIDKSKFVAFTFTKRSSPDKNFIKIHEHGCNDFAACDCGLSICSADNIKYLGVYLDSHLRWDSHIDYVTSKIRKMYFKFYQIRQWLPKKYLLSVYRALVESVIGYGLAVWGSVRDTVSSPLVIAQKRVLKIITFRPRRFPTDQLFSGARVLSLKQLYIRSVARVLLNSKHKVSRVDHYVHTRLITLNNVYVPSTPFSTTQRSLSFSAPRIFNIIPTELKMKPYRLVKNKLPGCLIAE